MSCSNKTAVMLPSMIRGQENNDQKTGLQLKEGGLLFLTFTKLLCER